MLDHGGNLAQAVQRYGRAREDWVDLSTGISPYPYPVPSLPEDAWHRLPEPCTALIAAACRYYGARSMLPVAGSQAAIQALPLLRNPARVALALPAYAEHRHHWQRAGHEIVDVPFAQLDAAVDHCDVVVVVSPNNPTGQTVGASTLMQWADRLAARGGWLIVDEAFGDLADGLSVASQAADHPGLIVLRSVGKFFGLAGLRLGFVAASPVLLARLADQLGPWTVSGPAQIIGTAALSDTAWQRAMRPRLQQDGQRLATLLLGAGIASHGCALFQYWRTDRPEAFAEHMAECGIWVRRFEHGIRLGLPANALAWQRLQHAVSAWQALHMSITTKRA